MIHSMTGYASQSRDFPGGSLHLEIRTVNSRFLDIHFRLADELRPLESLVRERISAQIRRGKVECRLYFSLTHAQGASLDPGVLASLRHLETQVRALMPEAAPLTVRDVLAWPGMLGDAALDCAALAPITGELADAVIAECNASRAREGAKLAALIAAHGEAMRAILAALAPHVPAAQAAFAARLKQRLAEALGAIDDNRILQEVALFAARIDVDEELARLKTHLDELDRILATGGPVGKRLDFLMQELNREANTLGSKAASREITQAAMQLKLRIEQMREQIQNLE